LAMFSMISARTVKLAKITSLSGSFSNEDLLQEFALRHIRKEKIRSKNFFFIYLQYKMNS